MKLLPTRKINQNKFKEKWVELQAYCKTKNTWGLALINADKLLDEAFERLSPKSLANSNRMLSAEIPASQERFSLTKDDRRSMKGQSEQDFYIERKPSSLLN